MPNTTISVNTMTVMRLLIWSLIITGILFFDLPEPHAKKIRLIKKLRSLARVVLPVPSEAVTLLPAISSTCAIICGILLNDYIESENERIQEEARIQTGNEQGGSGLRENASAEEATREELAVVKATEEATRKELEISKATERATRDEVEAVKKSLAWYHPTYHSQKQQLEHRATEARDYKRTIQIQAEEINSTKQVAASAHHLLKAKNEQIDIHINNATIFKTKIQHKEDFIARQAQRIKDLNYNVEAMAKQIEEKDQQLWQVAGRNTEADQQIVKLKGAVSNGYTASDYCCALNTIDRRDQTIDKLEKELAQRAQTDACNQEFVDSLNEVLSTLDSNSPAQGIIDLQTWAEEREVRWNYFVTHAGPVVTIRTDECERLCTTVNLQHKLLRNAVETRDGQRQTIAALKSQLVALESKEKATSKTNTQLTGEKQHLLDALTNAQHSGRSFRDDLSRCRMDMTVVRKQLSDLSVQQMLDEKTYTFWMKTNAAKLASVTKQLKTANKELEESDNRRVQEVLVLNNKVRMISEALRSVDIDCNLWEVEKSETLATILEDAQIRSHVQEARLAEISTLKAANEQLELDLLAQETKITSLNTLLSDTKTKAHNDFREWQSTLCKTSRALAIAKRDSPSRELENKVSALQTRLAASQNEAKDLYQARAAAEGLATDLKTQYRAQTDRLRTARKCLDRCINLNCELRKDLGAQSKVVEDLVARLEKRRDAFNDERDEVRRLNGLLEIREDEVEALEVAKEGLEKKLVLGDEFVEVTEDDVPLAMSMECAPEEEDELVVVREEDVKGSLDEVEAVDVDEDGEGLETVNGAPEIRVQ